MQNINNYDLTNFNFKSLASWAELATEYPRFPYIFIADAICCCHSIRRHLKIKKPFVSFLLALCMITSFENLSSMLKSEKLNIFSNPYDIPIILGIWILFKYSPFDLVAKLSWILTPILDIIRGLIMGRDISDGIIFADKNYSSSSTYIIIITTMFATLKYVLIYIVSKITQQNNKHLGILTNSTEYRAFGPTLFHAFLGVNIFYRFTDMGHISSTFWFNQKEMSLFIICFEGLLSLVQTIMLSISETFYETLWNSLGKIVGFVIPYYGQTWIPRNVQNSHVQDNHPEKQNNDGKQNVEKQKTE